MTPLSSRRVLPTVAILFVLALLAAACGGTNVVGPTDEPETTTGSPSPDPDPTTTALPPPTEAPLPTPDEIVDRVSITADDVPSNYFVEIGDDRGPLCDGRPSVDTRHPADAERALSISGDHVFNT
ncbi:MAG: hypothetical protein HKN26_11375, partial [Acidimicrobiales bacterium]|nr:hypothetical protein [Acidimicrobiales bacterium]